MGSTYAILLLIPLLLLDVVGWFVVLFLWAIPMLTKNPERIMQHWFIRKVLSYTGNDFPSNWWFGTTVTGENNDFKNIETIKEVPAQVLFVSFEPLLGLLPSDICFNGLQWVIIGKLTGSKRVSLDTYWVWRIKDEAQRHDIPIFMKNNLSPPWPKEDLIQQFPS